MKKALSLALALVFAFALAIPAFAENTNMSGNSQNVTATYTVSEAYTVSIPSGITFDADKSAQETVSVSGALINSGKKVQVKLAAADEDDAFELEYIENSAVVEALTYTVKVGETSVAATGTEVLSVAAGTATGSAIIDFAITEDANYQGTYTDSLTFSVAVVDANA